jgi:Flp pilus assembly protein TadD
VKTLNELAASYIRGGQYRFASAIYNRAVELDGKNPEALAGLGLGRLYLLDFDGAALMFKKALKLAPTEPMAVWNLSGLYSEFGFRNRVKDLADKRPRGSKPALLHPMAQKL